MARPDRLFRLLHLLRTLPGPVTAVRLAQETEVSPRTLYRDIASLRAGGALIDGEAGFGYALTEDPAVPPQMFTRLEVEALVLGLAEVRQTGDADLAAAAMAAQAKIVASLPERVQRQAMNAVLTVYRTSPRAAPSPHMAALRAACWAEEVVSISYTDANGVPSQRFIWPLAVAFLDNTQMLLAWCCLRQDFRKFMLSRIGAVAMTGESFRPRRVPLLRDYIGRLKSRSG